MQLMFSDRKRPRADQPQMVLTTAARGTLDVLVVATDASQSTVQLCGEADLATASLISAALGHELAHGHRFVRLDLSRLTFLDCSALREIVQAHHNFLAAHGTLVLTGRTPIVQRMLALTHLDEALFIGDGERSCDDAVGDDPDDGSGDDRDRTLRGRHLHAVRTQTTL